MSRKLAMEAPKCPECKNLSPAPDLLCWECWEHQPDSEIEARRDIIDAYKKAQSGKLTLTDLPKLDVTCDHQGVPGRSGYEEGNDYHCVQCCPGCFMHPRAA